MVVRGANMVGGMLQTHTARFTAARDLGSVALIEIRLPNPIPALDPQALRVDGSASSRRSRQRVFARPVRYDAMAVSIRFGLPYQTRLHSSPTEQRVAHEPTK
jgi:hypothetical protein